MWTTVERDLRKAKSLGWLVACLWDDEHDSYEWECQDTTGDGGISLGNISRRTRCWGPQRGMRGMYIWSLWRSAVDHSEELDVVVHCQSLCVSE
jgi:hypothetical protein